MVLEGYEHFILKLCLLNQKVVFVHSYSKIVEFWETKIHNCNGIMYEIDF